MKTPQSVVYWGQNGAGIIENNNLATYCTLTSGIDIIVLAFLSTLLQESDVPSGSIGQSCFITPSGDGEQCEDLALAIETCQMAGVTIILSLGGSASLLSIKSQTQAEAIGQYLWDAYGNSNNTKVQRPFGHTFVNGFDFDIESTDGSQYYQYVIAKLRSNFAKDYSRKYYITGAPQCPIPEPNMGTMIENSHFDYLWIQFYNNYCALGLGNGLSFNYSNWTTSLPSTASENASLFIGLPASPVAANGNSKGAIYYIPPEELAHFLKKKEELSDFGGVMMWNAGFSDANIYNNCTYAQNIRQILLNGSPCINSGPLTSTTTVLSVIKSTSTWLGQHSLLAATTVSGMGTVSQWGQCGGQGYLGPTQCSPPYSCIQLSNWWSSCR